MLLLGLVGFEIVLGDVLRRGGGGLGLAGLEDNGELILLGIKVLGLESDKLGKVW